MIAQFAAVNTSSTVEGKTIHDHKNQSITNVHNAQTKMVEFY